MIRRLAWLLLALLIIAGLAPSTPLVAAPPTGFTEEVVPGLDQLNQPTAFAFLPSGAILIATKPGKLLLYQNGVLRAQPVFDRESSICDNSERGLLGVAVDPAYATNRFIYVYYTFDKHGTKADTNPDNNCTTNVAATDPVNRVSRLALSAGLTTNTELVLIDNIPSPNGNHNAGDLHFGKDGYLYVSAGDGGRNDTARQLHNLDGTIMRITSDGGIPADNPFQGANTARCNTGSAAAGTRCQEIFAYGFRNPFRLAFDPNAATTRFFINDVGQGSVEEISAGQLGADFGWNCFEGTRVNKSDGACAGVAFASTVAPYFEYRRTGAFTGCASITGGAFVPAGVWPNSYDGAYLFADYVCRRMFTLLPGAGGPTSQLFDGDAGEVTHMAFGPYAATQALYYANIGAGDIVRVRYTGSANRSPSASFSAQPDFGEAPLNVSLDASASSDPDSGDSIVAYLWAFGDGASAETTGPTTSHNFTSEGKFTVTLRVRDSVGALSGNPASVRIDVGNTPPVPQILAPAAGALFDAGEQITLRGSATDEEDGPLAGAQLSWEVRRHHDTHFHPYLSTTGAEASLTAPAPEDLGAVNNSWLEIRLTATDSLSRTTTITRELRPRIVSLRFESAPAGLRVSVNDGVSTTTLDTPATLASWPGYGLTLSAPTGQRVGGVPMQLCGWRHGGAPAHLLVTLGSDSTLTAVFAPASQPCPAQVGDERLFLPLVRVRAAP